MAIYSKESLEALRQRIDLVDVLSAHIDLKRTGAAYKALCPFHDEKTPSFTIQKGDTHYHCYGCSAHGDAIQFLMSHLKMSFSDAVTSLAERFHVHLETVDGSQEFKGPSKTLLKEALDAACQFFHFMLLHSAEGHIILEYLYKRGLDLDFIYHFQVGFAPAKSGMLRAILHAKGIKDETMVSAGLLTQYSERSGFRDFFSDRITFPIRDAGGAVIGFSARKYKEETFGGKYINTSETPLFKKSKVLFGMNFCRRRIAKERKAIIVEGQIDALRLIQFGFNITVAGQGTAFGEGHVAELMALGINQVFLALDGDNAGQTAIFKIGDLFQKEGVEVKVVQLPNKTDPDAYLQQHGPEGFLKLLETSIDYLSFLVRYLSSSINMSSPAGKNELIQTISRQIRSWDHPVMVHESLRKLAYLTQTPESMIGVGQEVAPNIFIKQSASIGLQTIHPDRILEADFLRWLLLMAGSLPDFIPLARQNIPIDFLYVDVCKEMYKVIIECVVQGLSLDMLSVLGRMQHLESQALLNQLLDKKINKERAVELFHESMQKLMDRHWMRQREDISFKIKSGQHSDEEVMLLIKEFDALKKSPPKVQFAVNNIL